jgi:acetyltransferase-like isoleucine patch superfamily enzyme
MFRSLLGKMLLRIHSTIEGEIDRLRIARLLTSVSIGSSSKLYPQATVYNLQNDPSRIRIGDGTHIQGELYVFEYGGEIVIGDNCYVGVGSRIWSGERIVIGNNVLISHNVNIVDTTAHEMNHLQRAADFQRRMREGHPRTKINVLTAPVVIDDYAWISFNVCILKGVRIGKGAIVGGGSVVTDDVPDFVLVAGNPARIVRRLDAQ